MSAIAGPSVIAGSRAARADPARKIAGADAAAAVRLPGASGPIAADAVRVDPRTGLLRPPSFDERIAARTQALADRLTESMRRMGIPPDTAIDLRIDSFDQVRTDGPYGRTINEMFENDPALRKEFKDVAALNTMRAVQKTLDLFEEEKKAARDADERHAAGNRATHRLMKVRSLSGSMTLKDGRLISHAVGYIDAVVAVSGFADAVAETEARRAEASRFLSVAEIPPQDAGSRGASLGLRRAEGVP